MKTLIITHIDMDGSGVEILFKLYRPEADVIRVNYGWEDDINNVKLIAQYDELLFGDISFSPEFATKLDKSGKRILLFDHHDSAIRKFIDTNTLYKWMFFDTHRSGTKLVFDFLKSDSKYHEYDLYEDLVNMINDYDLWIHSDHRSTQLQFLWNGLGKDEFVNRFKKDPQLNFTESELEIILNSDQKLTDSINTAESTMNSTPYVDKDGYKFNYCSNVPHFVSLVATHILRKYNDLDYLLLNGGYGSISIRSTNIQINKIAESLGGGGHPLAAGFAINPTTDVVNSVINQKLVDFEFYNKFKKDGDNYEKEISSQS